MLSFITKMWLRIRAGRCEELVLPSLGRGVLTTMAPQRRGGQVLVLFTGALLVLAAVAVLAVDVGRLCVCEAELQDAVDAAALAGASQIVCGTTQAELTAATQEANSLAAANTVDATPLHLASSDIVFGHFDSTAGTFVPQPTATVVDSIKVTGRRTNTSTDGPINLLFGPLFGWNQQALDNVVGIATKPKRYVMFVLDRSGSMCFDTSGVTTHSMPNQNTIGYYMSSGASGWCALPQEMNSGGWTTAYFYALDNTTGLVRTDFLPPAMAATLVSGTYWTFSTGDSSGNNPSWFKIPSDVTVYSRYSTADWFCSSYYSDPSSSCAYATAGGPAQPIQSVMDAACAFVNLLRPVDDEAGLATFASGATTNSILTTNFASLEAMLQSFSPCGATAEGDGMKAGLDELINSGRADAYGQRIMILLTDGEANMVNGTSYSNTTQTYSFLGTSVTTEIPSQVAAAMASQTTRAISGNVRIYCVTFGTASDTAVHQAIANKTGGAFYYSGDHSGSELTDIFVDIFRRLPPVLTQ